MEKVKELERELKAKGEELEKIKKAREDLTVREHRNHYKLDKLRKERSLVFADTELDKNKMVEKSELKKKIKKLEEDLEDISFAMEGLEVKKEKLNKRIETLEEKKESLEVKLEGYRATKKEYEEAYGEEKEKEKRKKEGAIYMGYPWRQSPVQIKERKLKQLAWDLGMEEDLEKFFKEVEKELGS